VLIELFAGDGRIIREELGEFFITFFGLKHNDMEFIVEKIFWMMTMVS
jgi:hypothetical protein